MSPPDPGDRHLEVARDREQRDRVLLGVDAEQDRRIGTARVPRGVQALVRADDQDRLRVAALDLLELVAKRGERVVVAEALGEVGELVEQARSRSPRPSRPRSAARRRESAAQSPLRARRLAIGRRRPPPPAAPRRGAARPPPRAPRPWPPRRGGVTPCWRRSGLKAGERRLLGLLAVGQRQRLRLDRLRAGCSAVVLLRLGLISPRLRLRRPPSPPRRLRPRARAAPRRALARSRRIHR